VIKAEISKLLKLAEAGEEVVITSSGKPATKIKSTASLLRTFIDTNILVYAEDGSNSVKKLKATELILEHRRQKTGVVSQQILQEFFVTVRKKLKLDAEIARYKVEFHAKFIVAEPTVNDILAAIDMHRLHGFSYWDALVLRMAKQTGCRVVLTEDLQHGRMIDGIEIVNPFL
jgi:predicted nucleic acid-binding protein